MSSTYGTNNPVAYEGRVHYASLPNCLCISEDCCFEEGQPAGYCGQKHLFQSEEALVTCISNYINQRVAANNQVSRRRDFLRQTDIVPCGGYRMPRWKSCPRSSTQFDRLPYLCWIICCECLNMLSVRVLVL
jgi:hypothetical protein